MKKFTSKTQKVGEIGESQAVNFLKEQGYIIVARNIANKFGEIDIIAKKRNIYHFFEVKTGYKGGWVNPAENLTKTKLRKFIISVEYYCFIHAIQEYKIAGIIVLLPGDTASHAEVEIIDL